MAAPVTPVDKDGNPFEAGNPLHVTMGSGPSGPSEVIVTNFPATQPVSLAGVSTAANQATMITGLNTNNTILNELNTDFGTPGDAAWSGTGNGTVIAILKAIHAELVAIKNNTTTG